jgi:hypothetical protein
MTAPRLSVVVTLVDGGATLERCLAALARQHEPPDMEVLLPYDETAAGVREIGGRFEHVRMLPMGAVPTRAAAASPTGQHELFDRRRSHGLAAARGEVVALIEDRSVPRPDWARTLDRLHSRPDPVIGGAVEYDGGRSLNRAVYLCDFGRYRLPFEAGASPWTTDVNTSYKREALEQTRPIWKERYHEPRVHDAILRAGGTLWLDPALIVDQERGPLRLGAVLSERYHWARLFATIRVGDCSLARRVVYAVGAPFLPLILGARLLAGQAAKPRFTRVLAVLPQVLLLLFCWSLGEFTGYLAPTTRTSR